jgi:hypothetical protein
MQRERERLAVDSEEHVLDPDRIEEYMQHDPVQFAAREGERVFPDINLFENEDPNVVDHSDAMGDEWGEVDDTILVQEMERIDPSHPTQDTDMDIN